VDFSTFAGRDSAGFYQADLDPNFTPISGNRAILEHVARRIMTPLGSMQDDEYGFDLRSYYNANLSRLDLMRLKSAIETEAGKVEGVENADVSAVQDSAGVVQIEISVTLADEETYPLVFSLSSEGIKLLPLLGG
jgi:hypothetical protein